MEQSFAKLRAQGNLPTAWTASTGQMAHIMVGSSVSHVRLRKKVERGAVVTGHELCFFFAFGLQMLAVIVPRASILESRCAQPFFARSTWKHGSSRCRSRVCHGFQGSLVGRVFSMRCCVDRARRRHRTFANTMVSCNTGTGDLCIHL